MLRPVDISGDSSHTLAWLRVEKVMPLHSENRACWKHFSADKGSTSERLMSNREDRDSQRLPTFDSEYFLSPAPNPSMDERNLPAQFSKLRNLLSTVDTPTAVTIAHPPAIVGKMRNIPTVPQEIKIAAAEL